MYDVAIIGGGVVEEILNDEEVEKLKEGIVIMDLEKEKK